MTVEELKWKKFPVLNDGFVCLVDVMGDDSSVVQAARVSYGMDRRTATGHVLYKQGDEDAPRSIKDQNGDIVLGMCKLCGRAEIELDQACTQDRDVHLIRYLMSHRHTTPFEMSELKFLVRVPMDCWRQWIRHRTASVNEYSTRYSEAIDSKQKTDPRAWRLQATDNKQGSSGFLTPLLNDDGTPSSNSIAHMLSREEEELQQHSDRVYKHRIGCGIAREQARKDLPLSTYTEAYWKIDLHNLLHFLGLRMDSHAQQEIREYAKIIGEQIVKPLFPLTWEAFEDFRLGAMSLSRIEIQLIRAAVRGKKLVMPAGVSKRESEAAMAKLKALDLI